MVRALRKRDGEMLWSFDSVIDVTKSVYQAGYGNVLFVLGLPAD